MDLKNQLKEIKKMSDEQIGNLDLDELIAKMLNNIGISDPELRDTLIYSTFARIIGNKSLSYNQMETILDICLDHNHMFYQIGEANSDSVFTRSFSTLVAQLVMDRDRVDLFLSKNLAHKGIESSFLYLQKEEDTRGFVKGKGWAHSTAHGADLLSTSIMHPYFQSTQIIQALESIIASLLKNASYMDDEDERLIFAIEALLEKGMSEDILENWINSLSHSLDEIFRTEGFSLTFFKKRTNLMNFLKSLYFRLCYKNVCINSRMIIKESLKNWHDVLYQR
jgi:hypothetical protein